MKRVLPIVVLAACLGPQDDPSQVHDLRVIGASFDPPELMAPSCAGLLGAARGPDGGILPPDPLNFLAFARPVNMTWLVLDPSGGGRDINYELRACTEQGDLECDNEGKWVSLSMGTMQPGELKHSASLGLTTLEGSLFDGGTTLIQKTAEDDTYRGLGGIRIPLVLHITAGEEEVYAQKLMVYSCKLFPEQKQNVQPVIPSLILRDAGWDDGVKLDLQLAEEEDTLFMTPGPFSDLEEDYIVPSLQLKPVHLHESWKFSWYSTLGRFAPTTSGGTEFNGELNKPRSVWRPFKLDGGMITEQDVDFYVVVRDGRGGETWIKRTGHFIP